MTMKNRAETLYIPHEAMRFSGFRAMLETAQKPGCSYMYGALGMYMFSHAVWLAKEMQRGRFDRIVFIARDGYWAKRAYDVVAPAMGVQVPSDYVRISRKAAFSLHFRQPEELTQLPDWVDVTAHTPETLCALLSPSLRMDEAPSAMEAAGLPMQQLLTEEALPRFIAACQKCWDAAGAAAYREHARAYIAPKFTGKCATFDVGYNLRSEAVIRDLTGADITAFITHTDSDVPDRRGVPYRTLYGQSPCVSWVAREQFLLEDAPLCTGYDADGPVMTAVGERPCEAIRRSQEDALRFVEDMVRAYGERLAHMPFRPADGCAAFEHFLHCGPYRLMKPYRTNGVENAFHDGTKPGDSAFLQWRLMQTDLLLARGMPAWRVRLKRALIRQQEDPRSFWRKLNPFASE